MKKIAAHQDEINPFSDSVTPQNIHPCVEEIARAFGKLISRASQMHIRQMQKLHILIITER